MDYQQILGTRIRNFRKRAMLSQLQLEILIDASPGYLSRVENGELNPTKETLKKISEVLELSDREQEYLYGKLFYPASEEEVKSAVDASQDHLSKEGTFAYLLDDRCRVLAISQTFYKVLGLSELFVNASLGKGLMEVILDERGKILELIDTSNPDNALTYSLRKIYTDMGFMLDDEVFLETKKKILQNHITRDLWYQVESEGNMNYRPSEAMKVIFKLNGQSISMNYSLNTLLQRRRFDLVEFKY